MTGAEKYRKRPVEIEAMLFDGGEENGRAVMDWVNSNSDWIDHGNGSARVKPCALKARGTTERIGTDENGMGLYQRTQEGYEWLEIETLEGRMRGDIGDYIIRGVQGEFCEFYPCKPDIFEKTYEKVEPADGN